MNGAERLVSLMGKMMRQIQKTSDIVYGVVADTNPLIISIGDMQINEHFIVAEKGVLYSLYRGEEVKMLSTNNGQKFYILKLLENGDEPEVSTIAWIPDVTEDGIISWTRSDTEVPPLPVNIMGPQGPRGAKGDTGATGERPTILIGTTTTIDSGNANVTNSGTNTDLILNFTLVRGPQGQQGIQGNTGAAATVTVGEVEGLPDGSDPYVRNSGTIYAAILDFGLVAGPVGPKGDEGEAGETGPEGPAGPGFAPGGTTGQIIAKASNDDFDTIWIDYLGGDMKKEDYDPDGTISTYGSIPGWMQQAGPLADYLQRGLVYSGGDIEYTNGIGTIPGIAATQLTSLLNNPNLWNLPLGLTAGTFQRIWAVAGVTGHPPGMAANDLAGFVGGQTAAGDVFLFVTQKSASPNGSTGEIAWKMWNNDGFYWSNWRTLGSDVGSAETQFGTVFTSTVRNTSGDLVIRCDTANIVVNRAGTSLARFSATDFAPAASSANTYNLGTDTNRWLNGYFAGTVYMNGAQTSGVIEPTANNSIQFGTNANNFSIVNTRVLRANSQLNLTTTSNSPIVQYPNNQTQHGVVAQFTTGLYLRPGGVDTSAGSYLGSAQFPWDNIYARGATLTGNITTTATPTAATHLTTKAYVDAAVASGGSSGETVYKASFWGVTIDTNLREFTLSGTAGSYVCILAVVLDDNGRHRTLCQRPGFSGTLDAPGAWSSDACSGTYDTYVSVRLTYPTTANLHVYYTTGLSSAAG